MIDETMTAEANIFFLSVNFLAYVAGPLRKASAKIKLSIERVKSVVNF